MSGTDSDHVPAATPGRGDLFRTWTIRLIAVVFLVAVSAAVSHKLTVEMMTESGRVPGSVITTEDGGRFYYATTPSRTTEFLRDKDKDGKFEEWSLDAWRGTPECLSYTVKRDTDGTVRQVLTCVGGESGHPAVWLLTEDFDKDGRMDAQYFTLIPTGDITTALRYWDLNLDGRLDVLCDGSQHMNTILWNNTWTPTLKESLLPRGDGTATIMLDGVETSVVFKDGTWQLP